MALFDGSLPLVGEVQTLELDSAGTIGPEGSDESVGDDAEVEVPGAELVSREDRGVLGSVGAPASLEGDTLDVETVTIVTCVVVRSVISVVDSLVAMVVI